MNADIRKTATNWPNKALSQSRRTCSGGRSRASISALLPMPTGQHGLRLYGAYDRDAGADDVTDTVNAVANLKECNGKVASMAIASARLMIFLTAVRNSGVDAAVAYHGGDTEKYLGEVDGLRAPILMHLAEEDEFISKAAQAQIKAALAGKPNATVYSYPGQHHAFARHNGAHYDAAAAALANGRTAEFLHRQLR